MTKHTPGPWDVYQKNPRLVKHTSGPVLAQCTTPNAAEAFANARLIAAAPDMHALLTITVARIETKDSPPLLAAWVEDAKQLLASIE